MVRHSPATALPDPRHHGTDAAAHSRLYTVVSKSVAITLGALIALLVTGCHHHTQQAYQPPPPPSTSRSAHSTYPTTSSRGGRPPQPAPPDNLTGKPTLVETGMASWYGSGKRAADGSVFDKNAMTAAHKTLPLGTTVRVTNLVNGESVLVKITDRGPFSHGRVLDLSEGAAKKIDLYRMGVAKVKIEAFAHATASAAGKWVVQTGAFKTEDDALDLKAALAKRYATSRVTSFHSSTGYWVRIDPPNYDHAQAIAINNWIGSPDPGATSYVVRVD